jgi:hypothetical protein
MNRFGLRRGLAWSLVATLLLPVALAVVAGLAGLLAALGDGGGAAVCGRAALGLGVVWLVSLVVTVALTALTLLAAPDRRGPPPRRRKPGRRRRMPSLVAERLAAEREARERPA